MKARANRRANIDVHLDLERAYGRRWRDQNRGRQRSYWRRRHAAKPHAAPAWLTDGQNEAMVAIYEQAEHLTRETGILHEVNHIIPLNHPDVCGLHVLWNLQVLTLPENRQKSNSFNGTLDNNAWRV
jgi:5-methylcytosine-specific restriction endonuclease McrA